MQRKLSLRYDRPPVNFDVPGLVKMMDIGLTLGTNDQKLSKVIFEDLQLIKED